MPRRLRSAISDMSKNIQQLSKYFLVTLLLGSLAACSIGLPKIPRVHKITVQQGNVITQEMIDQLKPGMSRSQVAYIMGEPILRNTFDPNRWDYVYTLEIPGYFENDIHMTLYFQNEILAYFTGDLAPTDALPADDSAAEEDQAS